MNKLLFGLSIFAAVLCSSASGYAQHSWQPLAGPYGAVDIQGIIASPTGTFYAVIYCGGDALIRSTDDGLSWVLLPNAPPALRNANRTAYSEFEGIRIDPGGNVVLQLLDPTDDSAAVFLSTDQGDSWRLLADSIKWFLGTGKANECFISSISGKVLRSIDAGASWTDITAAVGGASYGPMNWRGGNSYVLCQGSNSFAYTTDNWNTRQGCDDYFWYNYEPPTQTFMMPNGNFIALNGTHVMIGDLVHPICDSFDISPNLAGGSFAAAANLAVMLAQYSSNIYFIDTVNSTLHSCAGAPPGGASVPPRSKVYSIAGNQRGTILLWNGESIFRSTDTGRNWSECPMAYDDPTQIQIDREGRIFTKRTYPDAYNDASWLNVSENQGRTWKKISPIGGAYLGWLGQGYDGGIITTVEDTAPPCGGQNLYYYGGVESAEWTELTTTGEGYEPSAILTDSGNTVFITQSTDLQTSDDLGVSWVKNPTLPISPVALAFSPSWKIYTSDGDVIYTSADGGQTWQTIHIGIRSLRLKLIVIPQEGNLYITTQFDGAYHSTDNGAHWTQLSGPWGDGVTCLGATSDGTIYIGTSSQGLFSANADGSNPVQEPLQLPTNAVNTIYVTKSDEVYIGASYSPLWVTQGSSSSGITGAKDAGIPYDVQLLGGASGSSLQITSTEYVELQIDLYNSLGIRVREFGQPSFAPGVHDMPLDLHDLASGAYFLRITSGANSKIVAIIH